MTSPSEAAVRLSAEFDRSLVWEKGKSVRYLGVGLSAAAPAARAAKRPALNLALVIDASGSMNGARLDAAKQAAIDVLERLTPDDVLSVVSFASDVITHADALPMAPGGKRTAQSAVQGLTTRGSTNLSGGWQRGAECVAAYGRRQPGCHNRVLLLTDGRANEGVVDPLELARQAEQLCGAGISTSAVGVGSGYSSAQIEPIAGNGGGQLHHAATPAEIVEVVMGELGDLAGTAAENVTVEVAHSPGVRVEMLGEFPLSQQEHQLRATLGALIAGRPRRAVFEVTAPAGNPGEQLPFHVRAQWNVPDSGELRTASVAPAVLHFAEESANNAQTRDVGLSVEVARVWVGFVMQRAVQLNREGVYSEARQLLETELGYLERYCRGLPGSEGLLAGMRTALADIGRAWDEGRRKEVGNFNRKMTRQEAEHRSGHQWES